MREFSPPRVQDVSQAAPAGASAPVAARTSERETTRRSRAVGLLVICGLSLAAVVAAATAVMVIDLRERSLAASERELKNTALVLAEQTDRAFHADRKSTRLNSSHSQISYAVFCL